MVNNCRRADTLPIESAVKVFWSAGSVTENGAYGLYPVGCTNVLIEDTEVSGASDAGIEIENSSFCVSDIGTSTFRMADVPTAGRTR